MNYLSLFSGIEAATEAWGPLGWKCVGVSEIEPYPCSLLAQRYPGVRNLGDVTKITEADIMMLGHIDLVVFGSPCQDLSVAGKRKGLDGARSGLFFTALQIVRWARAWCGLRGALWENVPGAFSSNKGADFAAVVDALAGLDGTEVPPKGWGTEGCAVGSEAMVEWSTLDAQWFGVAQRRRRVFALADFGDWASRPPILLEPESVRGDSAPSRSAGEDSTRPVAPCLTSSRAEREQRPVLTPSTGEVDHCLNAGGMGRIDYETETLVAYMPYRTLCADGAVDEGFAARQISDALHTSSGSGNKAPLIAFNSNAQPDEMRFDAHVTAPLTCSQIRAIAFHPHCIGRAADAGPQGKEYLTDGSAYTIDSRGQAQAVCATGEKTHALRVRRLTPTECERLQGFPDGYTLINHRGKPAADGPRYKALGNSMAVPVMRWIGQQIDFAWRYF